MSHRHQTLLVAATILSRIISFLLLQVSSRLPLFDSSPLLVTTSKWAQPLLRWDTFHFLHIAEHGYVYENEWAFFPGVPFVMRISATLLHLLFNSQPNLLVAGALATIACDTTRTLYQLTLHHLGSPTLAYLTALLSLMPSNPTTLYLVPYSEPFFTYLSYKGKCASSCIYI
jgi:phosphatidylinositol glycan class V